MLEKLHGVEEKYLDLEAKLSDPEVVSDPEQYLKYAKAHAKLQEIVNVYREYKEQKNLYDDDIAVAEEDSDPELAEIAREEAESLKPALEEYEKCSCTQLGRLIANRELPVLKRAKEILDDL